jgi:hypothetical protein
MRCRIRGGHPGGTGEEQASREREKDPLRVARFEERHERENSSSRPRKERRADGPDQRIGRTALPRDGIATIFLSNDRRTA